MSERDPRIDPRPGDSIRKGTKVRTVTDRRGHAIWYEPTIRPGCDCWITTWQNWARTAEVIAKGEA